MLSTNINIKENAINKYLCYSVYQDNIFNHEDENKNEYFLFYITKNVSIKKDDYELAKRDSGSLLSKKLSNDDVTGHLHKKLQKVSFSARNQKQSNLHLFIISFIYLIYDILITIYYYNQLLLSKINIILSYRN